MSTVRQVLRSYVPAQLRPHLGALRRMIVAHPLRVAAQKRRLIRNPTLRPGQSELLHVVNDQIHFRDGMYTGDGANYFLAGLSALDCVEEALRQVGPKSIRRVLDLPSGYGRELRFLAQRFPDAAFTACDIHPGAVDFCARAFGAIAAYSQPEMSRMSFATDFDLIWCGSLITHLDRAAIAELLALFARHLSTSGVLIFTTNGDFVTRRMLDEGATYELQEADIPVITSSYSQTGYGYRDYPRGLGYFDFHPEKSRYGVSLTSPDWIRKLARGAGGLREVSFKEHGWCDHQDVFGFVKQDD